MHHLHKRRNLMPSPNHLIEENGMEEDDDDKE
jgi:hypothetical protein